MAAKLKVFRTPIGFHDAYVATSSRKAALAAWGATGDLFAHGQAELVTDARLMEAPLADPGTVITVVRGSAEEHLAALPKTKLAKTRKTVAKPASSPAGRSSTSRSSKPARAPLKPKPANPEPAPSEPDKPKPAQPPVRKPPPRPSREKLDAAEKEREGQRATFKAQLEHLENKRKRLDAEIAKVRKAQETADRKFDARVEKARTKYEAALARWRNQDQRWREAD